MNHPTTWTRVLAMSLAAVVAAITLAWAGAAAASSATARPSAGAELSRAAVWHTHSYYERLSDCQAVGRSLVAQGLYRAWACEDWGFWALRVLD